MADYNLSTYSTPAHSLTDSMLVNPSPTSSMGVPKIVVQCQSQEVSPAVSIAPSGGGPVIPSTGQIYPLGYQ